MQPVTVTRDNEYADMACEGCENGEACYGWSTETLKCPSRIPFDRELDEYQRAVREYEDENGL